MGRGRKRASGQLTHLFSAFTQPNFVVPHPPPYFTGGETSSPQFPFPAPLQGRLWLQRQGGDRGSSCSVGIIAKPRSSWEGWERHETAAHPTSDSWQPSDPRPEGCQHTEGSRDRGVIAGRRKQCFGSVRVAAGSCCWGFGTPGWTQSPSACRKLSAQPEGQKQRWPNWGFWELSVPGVSPSPSLDTQR